MYFCAYFVSAAPLLNNPFRKLLQAMLSLLPLDLGPIGGGTGNDPAFVLAALLMAAAITPIWSFLHRSATNYEHLHQWLRWGVRYFVLGMMVIYGVAKLMQFPPPAASQLLEPLGHLSRMQLLWVFMGSSQMYTLFTGVCEVFGGVLLLGRRTTTLGALICIAAMTNVWLINVAYDVPVKVLSFHLLLMACFLVLPDLRRLTQFFLRNEPVKPSPQPPLFENPRWNRAGNVCRIFLVLGIVVFTGFMVRLSMNARTASELAGIWFVEEFETNGEARPPLVTDGGRWRHVVFDYSNAFAIQPMTGTIQRYSLRLDSERTVITLGRPGSPRWKAEFGVDRLADDALILSGAFDGVPLRAKLTRVPPATFRLVESGN